MPQMKPLMWTLVALMTLIMIMILIIKIFFTPTFFLNKMTKKPQFPPKKWKW